MQQNITLRPKLKDTETTIFTIMSRLATEHNAVNLGQGFPDFDCDPTLLDLINKYLKERKNQYCPLAGLPQLLEVLAKKIERLYGMRLNPETQICITAGATQALYTAIMAFVHPGDEVVIVEPAYDCYKSQIELAGGKPVPYQITYPDYTIDWDEFGSLISDKTSMIIINTPHNPSGSILRKADLKALESLVQGKNIVVLSDEVYEHLIYDGEEHQSVMRYPALFERSMAVFSFGKTLHATGWKLGYVVAPEHLMNAFKVIHQWNVFCVNSFLQFAIADYLKEPEHYDYLPAFFQKKRDTMNELFADVPLKPIEAKGTYFQLYNYEEISDLQDPEFAKYLTTKIGVAATSRPAAPASSPCPSSH